MKLSFLLPFSVFLPVAFCQIRPDVSFDEKNDRFDLTPLIQEGNVDQWGDIMDGVRRAVGPSRRDNDEGTKLSDPTANFMEALQGFQRNFNFNEEAESENPEEKVQLRRDLISYLHENQPGLDTRRAGNIDRTEAEVEREVMIHHAVPIVLKVEGIMQMPTATNDK